LSAPLGSPRIIVGNKGVGKTAIIERTFNANREQDIPSVLLRPDDIDLSKIGNASDVATVKKVLFEALVGAVAAQIGSKLKGLLDESTAELHKLAVKKGLKAADRVEKGLTLLSTIAKPLTQIDFNQLSQALSGGESQGRLYEALKQHLSSRTSLFVLLVDDTDQIASPDDLNHLNRIWGLLLAIRKLANDLPNIECLVTLRTEIWMRLQRDEKGQRDQVDHIRPLVVNLRAQDEHMARILDKRIFAAAAHIGHTGSAWEAFFESQEMVLPGSNEKRSWRSFLLKSSRERPRDLIQLVGSLIETAQRRRHIRITRSLSEYSHDPLHVE
jgi:Cdc6-like AAA superfamily ATPase